MGLEFSTLKGIGAFLKERRKGLCKSVKDFSSLLESDDPEEKISCSYLGGFERGVFPRAEGRSKMNRNFSQYMTALDLTEEEQKQIRDSIEKYYENRRALIAGRSF